jgi:hypothetical protein
MSHYKKSPYMFRCFFTKDIKCGKFNPRIYKRKHVLPEPCKRCKYYTDRKQKTIEWTIGKTLSPLGVNSQVTRVSHVSTTEKTAKKVSKG